MYFEIIWNDNDILNIDIFVKIEFNVLCSWRDLKDVTKFYFSVECRKFLRKIDSKRKFIKLNNSCNGEKTGEILIVNNDSNSQKNGSLHFNVGKLYTHSKNPNGPKSQNMSPNFGYRMQKS